MIVRSATPADLDIIFLMGYDAWGGQQPVDAYLAGCRASGKYRKGRWLVAIDGQDIAVSSLLLWDFPMPGATVRGIGSVATSPRHRRQGHASHLIAAVMADQESSEQADAFLLYADIAPAMYVRLGFTALPPDLQRHHDSLCKVRYAQPPSTALQDAVAGHVPAYF